MVLKAEYWSELPFPPSVDHVLSELPLMTCPSWVALHGIAHGFIELCKPLHHNKAVIHGSGLTTKLCATLVTPWTVVCQAPLSMGFPRQEYWSRLPFPSPGDLPDPGIELKSPASVSIFCAFLEKRIWGYFSKVKSGRVSIYYFIDPGKHTSVGLECG